MTPQELQETVKTFKAKYPHLQGLNGQQMRAILDGKLSIVRVPGKPAFTLAEPEKANEIQQRFIAARKCANRAARVKSAENKRRLYEALGKADPDLPVFVEELGRLTRRPKRR